MHDLAPMTALGGDSARSDTIGPVTISESPDWALASVAARQGQDATCAAALADLLGVPSPDVAGYVQGAGFAAFWIGPGAWMVAAPYPDHADIAATLRDRLGGCASVTDQSDAWVRFDLRGEMLAQLFERLCNLDMDRMHPGTARRSVIEHLGCFVIRDGGGLHVLGPRSSAQSLHHALLTAARSVF